MSLAVVLFFAIGTLGEVYLLTVVSGYISIINTLSLIMFTFLVGNIIGRSWGKEYFEKILKYSHGKRSAKLPRQDIRKGFLRHRESPRARPALFHREYNKSVLPPIGGLPRKKRF